MRLVLLIIAGCFFAGCQTPRSHPGVPVAERYWDALGNANWTLLADLTHSESMAGVKETIISAVEKLPHRADMAPYMSTFSSLEDVLAGMEIGQVSELREMPPLEVYRRFLLQEGESGDAVTSIMTGVENESESRIVGYVAESDSLVHVLRRAIFVGAEPVAPASKVQQWREGSKMDVLSLRLDSGEWRVWQNTGFSMKLAVATRLAI